ncbi:MAG: anti-sigma regulatory factor [candidate division WOR-3 bacterium]
MKEEILRIPIVKEIDVLIARREVKNQAEKIGFRWIDQTRIATAVSELTRNIIKHAYRGEVIVYKDEGGMEIVFQDEGPGIPDIEKAMERGYSTSNSLGIGLIGAKHLMDEFKIESNERGTKVITYKRLR